MDAKIGRNLSAAQAARKGQPHSLCAEFRGWSLRHDVSPLWQNTKSKERNNSGTGPFGHAFAQGITQLKRIAALLEDAATDLPDLVRA